MKIIEPQLPFWAKNNKLTPLIVTNIVGFAIKQYSDNQKINELADVMLESSAVELMDSFNIGELIDQLFSDIKVPKVDEVTDFSKLSKKGLRKELAKIKG